MGMNNEYVYMYLDIYVSAYHITWKYDSLNEREYRSIGKRFLISYIV